MEAWAPQLEEKFTACAAKLGWLPCRAVEGSTRSCVLGGDSMTGTSSSKLAWARYVVASLARCARWRAAQTTERLTADRGRADDGARALLQAGHADTRSSFLAGQAPAADCQHNTAPGQRDGDLRIYQQCARSRLVQLNLAFTDKVSGQSMRSCTVRIPCRLVSDAQEYPEPCMSLLEHQQHTCPWTSLQSTITPKAKGKCKRQEQYRQRH